MIFSLLNNFKCQSSFKEKLGEIIYLKIGAFLSEISPSEKCSLKNRLILLKATYN